MGRTFTLVTAPLILLLIARAPEARAQESAAYSQFASCLARFQPKPYDLGAWTQSNPDAMCYSTMNAVNKYLNESGCSGGFQCKGYKDFQAYTPFYSTTGRAVTVPHLSGVCQNPDGEVAGISVNTAVHQDKITYNSVIPVPLGKNPSPREIAERMAQNVGAPFAAYHGERYGNGTVASLMAEPGTHPVIDGGYVGTPLPKGLGEVVATSYGEVYVVQRLGADKPVGPVKVGGSTTNIMPYGNGAAMIGIEEATKKVPGLRTTLAVLLPFAAGNSMPEGHVNYRVSDNLTVGAKTFATVVLPQAEKGIQIPRAYAQYDLKRSDLTLSAYADSHGLADFHLQKGPFSGTVGEAHGDIPFRLTTNLALPKWMADFKAQAFVGRAPRMVNLDFGDLAHDLVNPYGHSMQYPDSAFHSEAPQMYAGFHLEFRKPAATAALKPKKAQTVEVLPASSGSNANSGAADSISLPPAAN